MQGLVLLRGGCQPSPASSWLLPHQPKRFFAKKGETFNRRERIRSRYAKTAEANKQKLKESQAAEDQSKKPPEQQKKELPVQGDSDATNPWMGRYGKSNAAAKQDLTHFGNRRYQPQKGNPLWNSSEQIEIEEMMKPEDVSLDQASTETHAPPKFSNEAKRILKIRKNFRYPCIFCLPHGFVEEAHPMNPHFLLKFMTQGGRILSRRSTGCCRRHQKFISKVIKRATHIGVFSYDGGFHVISPFIKSFPFKYNWPDHPDAIIRDPSGTIRQGLLDKVLTPEGKLRVKEENIKEQYERDVFKSKNLLVNSLRTFMKSNRMIGLPEEDSVAGDSPAAIDEEFYDKIHRGDLPEDPSKQLKPHVEQYKAEMKQQWIKENVEKPEESLDEYQERFGRNFDKPNLKYEFTLAGQYPHDDMKPEQIYQIAAYDTELSLELLRYGIPTPGTGFFGGDWKIFKKVAELMTRDDLEEQRAKIAEYERVAEERGELVDWSRVLTVPPALLEALGIVKDPETAEPSFDPKKVIFQRPNAEGEQNVLSRFNLTLKSAIAKDDQSTEGEKEGEELIHPIVYEQLFGESRRMTDWYLEAAQQTREKMAKNMENGTVLSKLAPQGERYRILAEVEDEMLKEFDLDEYVKQKFSLLSPKDETNPLTGMVAHLFKTPGEQTFSEHKTGHHVELLPGMAPLPPRKYPWIKKGTDPKVAEQIEKKHKQDQEKRAAFQEELTQLLVTSEKAESLETGLELMNFQRHLETDVTKYSWYEEFKKEVEGENESDFDRI